MAMPEGIKNQRDFILEQLDSAPIEADKKMVFTNLLNHAALGTNGLTKEEKLQNVAESLFQLVSLNLLRVIRDSQKRKTEGLYAMIAECRWQITIAIGIVAFLLSQQPQLANLLEKLL